MYRVEFSNLAAKELEKIHKADRFLYGRLVSAIQSLQTNPFQGKKLFFFAPQIERNVASKQYSAPRGIIAAKPTRDSFLKRSRIKGPFRGDYSQRVGNYRIIYTVRKTKLVVYIIDLGHRKEIYKT